MLDHPHYERWLSTHIVDLWQLPETNPDLEAQFSDHGSFVCSKSGRMFSAMGLDQAHEQSNRGQKSFHGALGGDLVEVWGYAVPQLMAMAEEVGGILPISDEESHLQHHQDNPTSEGRFRSDLESFATSMLLHNPFGGGDICFVNSGEMMNSCKSISHSARTLYADGKARFHTFIEERFIERSVQLTSTIKAPEIMLPGDEDAMEKGRLLTAKQECKLLMELKDVIPKRRDAAIFAFYHEPCNIPATFTKHGTAYHASKSTVLARLRKETGATETLPSCRREQAALVVDLSVVVMMMSRGRYPTFDHFFIAVWKHIYDRLGRDYTRIDIVTDSYGKVNQLKAATRAGRGSGSEISNFTATSIFPRDFSDDFMKNTANKKQLYQLLVAFLLEKSEECSKTIIVTREEDVVGNSVDVVSELGSSSHLEADTRMVLHVLNALRHGFTRVTVRSNDTDVVVIMTAHFENFLRAANSTSIEIVVMCGTSKSPYYLDLSRIVQYIGSHKCRGLLFLFAVSGCDYVNSFFEVGKMTWLDAYIDSCSSIHETFDKLLSDPSSVIDLFPKIEEFVLQLYGVRNPAKGSSCARIEQLLYRTVTTLRMLPPSKGALYNQVLRALYVSSFVWDKAHLAKPEEVLLIGPPTDWGWCLQDGKLTPNWTSCIIAEGNDPFKQLLSVCKCKVGCISTRCSCSLKNFKCWAKCFCCGDCSE